MTKSTHSYDRYLYLPFLYGFSIWTIFLLLVLSPPASNLPMNDTIATTATNATNATNTTNTTNTSSLHTIDGLQSNGCYCRKLKWYEFVLFYALNYGAHAFSVITPPSCSRVRSVIWVILCLCFPYAGMGAPVVLVASLKHWPWKENPFQKALRAGALCMVVRTQDWRPLHNGMTIPTLHLKEIEQPSKTDSQIPPGTYKVLIPAEGTSISSRSTIVQGQYHLPQGFAFATIPPNASIHKNYPSLDYPKLSHSLQTIKTLISSAQVCVAVFTLLRVSSECGQLKKYGSASPAITVIPYGIMSFVNAIANSITPSYPTQYIIGSSILDEAKLYGGEFDTVVGRLEELENNNYRRNVISISPDGEWLTEVRENTCKNGEAIDRARQERLEDTEQEQALEENYGARTREQGGIQESDRRESGDNESRPLCGQLHLAVSPNLETNCDNVMRDLSILLILLILSIAPFIITRRLTNFNVCMNSSRCSVIFAWLLLGLIWGLLIFMFGYTRVSPGSEKQWEEVKVFTLFYACIPIWGFVIVGEMLNELGECTRLS